MAFSISLYKLQEKGYWTCEL